MALCDVDDQYAAESLAAHPGARRFRDFREMLDKMGREIDAVVVKSLLISRSSCTGTPLSLTVIRGQAARLPDESNFAAVKSTS